jgi:hypothetical protein
LSFSPPPSPISPEGGGLLVSRQFSLFFFLPSSSYFPSWSHPDGGGVSEYWREYVWSWAVHTNPLCFCESWLHDPIAFARLSLRPNRINGSNPLYICLRDMNMSKRSWITIAHTPRPRVPKNTLCACEFDPRIALLVSLFGSPASKG